MKRTISHYFLAAFCGIAPFLMTLATGAPALISLPRRVVVPKLQGPLTMDGRLNEPVWAKAALLAPFMLNATSKRAREKTDVRLWYDDHALYFGWTCTDTDIQATFTARDSQLWDEEVVECFITPGRLDRYFELQWNPTGGVFDAKIKNKLDRSGLSIKFTGDNRFTAKGMQNAVLIKGNAGKSNHKDKMWQVEVMIPFASLGESTPKPKSTWRANFYRYNRAETKAAELLSWSPTLRPGFHEPTRFGYLEFGQ